MNSNDKIVISDFDCSATAFSFKNAAFLAEASDLVYKSQEDYIKALKEWGFSEIYPLDKKETQGFVAKNENLILVVFRGTEQTKIEDILVDALAWQANSRMGKIHFGFFNALKFVWKDLLKALKKLRDNNQPIWISGHSLGGALATLAAARLEYKRQPYEIKGLYTFGKPRVGDKDFRAKFDQLLGGRAFRVTNYKDPVSIIPFSLKLKIRKLVIALQYKHTGDLVLFGEFGDLAVKDDMVSRVTLVGLGIFLAVVAVIARLLKKAKIPADMTKLVNSLIEPHSLEIYKANIQKNIGSVYSKLEDNALET